MFAMQTIYLCEKGNNFCSFLLFFFFTSFWYKTKTQIQKSNNITFYIKHFLNKFFKPVTPIEINSLVFST